MTSRFVTLSSYCVLEFKLTPVGDPDAEIINSSFYVNTNANVDLIQVYNTDSYTNVTKNTRDLNLIPIGGSKLIRANIDTVPIYTSYDPNIVESSVNPSLSNFLIMDTLRFHFASGFNFSEVENIILGARHKLNNLKQVQLANVLMTAELASNLLTFNNKPLFLANTIYDKYVDIKIPSIPNIDQDFIQFGSASFEAAITGNVGFIKDCPITVFLSEATYEEYNADNGETYDLYRVVNYYEGSVSQKNQFDGLGAVIQEAADGDYLQFFATWNNAFPDGLISVLNEQGPDNDWIISHELRVYEQIGSALVPSGNFIVYQEEGFDGPMAYRPILKEAGFAVSMSVDYTVRLLNRATGDQVIRTGSLTIWNPNKYGKQLLKLQLADLPQSLKVYNKIVQKSIEASSLFIGKPKNQIRSANQTVVTQIKEVKVGVPTFHKQANIRISQKNALLKMTNGESELIFGQGELILPIDPTDNFVKFTIYEADSANPSKQKPADLNSNSTFTLNFGQKSPLSYNSLTDPAYENPSVGQIAFKIPKDQAKKILESDDYSMYLCLIAEDGSETLMYSGKWLPSTDYAQILKAAESAKNAILNDPQATIASLNNRISALEKTNADLTNRLSADKPPTIPRSMRGDVQTRSETYQSINPIASQSTAISSKTEASTAMPTTVAPDADFTETTTRRSYHNGRIQSAE